MKAKGKMQITGFKPITNSTQSTDLTVQIRQDPAVRKAISKQKRLERAKFKRV